MRVGCLVNGSIGYWIPSSVVWRDGGSLCQSGILWSVGRLVGQVFGGLSAVRSDNQGFVWLVDRVVVSCAWSVGRPVCRLGSGWIG